MTTTIEYQLFELPKYLLRSLEDIYNKENKLKHDLARKVSIEQFYSIEFTKKFTNFNLCCVFNHENNNHFTLGYKNPKHLKNAVGGHSMTICKGLSKKSMIFTVDLKILMRTNKIPLIIAYEVCTE